MEARTVYMTTPRRAACSMKLTSHIRNVQDMIAAAAQGQGARVRRGSLAFWSEAEPFHGHPMQRTVLVAVLLQCAGDFVLHMSWLRVITKPHRILPDICPPPSPLGRREGAGPKAYQARAHARAAVAAR